MAKEKLIAIHWLPKSYLADTELMDRATEHAYFRLLQYIYLTQDRLPDDDAKVARLLKCKSVAEWRKIKAELLQPRGVDPETGEEIPARIYIEGGKILSKKCSEKLAEASKARKQKSVAGKASANKRHKPAKSPIYKESGSTVAGTAEHTAEITADGAADTTAVTTAEGTNLNSLSYRKTTPLPPSQSSTGSASGPSARAARPSTPTPEQDPYAHGFTDKHDRVVVHQPHGVILKIGPTGSVDCIAHDRDAAPEAMSNEDAMRLRAEALGQPPVPAAVPTRPKPAPADDYAALPAFLDKRDALTRKPWEAA